MILFIDTSDEEARLALIDGTKIASRKFVSRRISENLLPNIQNLLKKNKADFKHLKKIAVVTGPGPFSRIRTAVVTSNVLAYALDVPVTGIRSSEVPADLTILDKFKTTKQVLPFYQKPPNITKPKNK